MDDDSSSSDCDFETLSPIRNMSTLPFDANSLEELILSIGDRFNFRVVLGNKATRQAICTGAGLALAGTLLGRHFGGKLGAAVGGMVGGACGVGLVIMSLRELWPDIRGQLADVFDVVYDFLANLGIEDYCHAALFITQPGDGQLQLASVVLQAVSSKLGKEVLSSLTAA